MKRLEKNIKLKIEVINCELIQVSFLDEILIIKDVPLDSERIYWLSQYKELMVDAVDLYNWEIIDTEQLVYLITGEK